MLVTLRVSKKKVLPLKLPVKYHEENVILPEFKAGKDVLKHYIANELKNFDIKKYNDSVYVTFTVNTDGSISNVKLVKAIDECPHCSKKVEEMIKRMPKWNPAYRTDKNKLNAIVWEESLDIEF